MPVSHDVPQGSKMGSTLFLLYINDLFPELPAGSVIAYADDVTLVASDVSATAATAALQRFLDIVSVWSTNNCLRLNPSKCTFVYSTNQTESCYLWPVAWQHSERQRQPHSRYSVTQNSRSNFYSRPGFETTRQKCVH